MGCKENSIRRLGMLPNVTDWAVEQERVKKILVGRSLKLCIVTRNVDCVADALLADRVA